MVYGIITIHAVLTTDGGCRSKSPSLSPEFAIPNAKEKERSGRKTDKSNFKTNQTLTLVGGNGMRNG